MSNLSLLIKPASSSCNLACKYCFYSDLSNKRETPNMGIMSREIQEELVKKAIAESTSCCNFAFQGGEPVIAGLDYFNNLIMLQEKYNTRNINIYNSIQTNGILINEEWARFLSKNNFLVGLSLDGYENIHDSNRVDSAGMGTFGKIMKTIELFNKYNVQYNILFVVTKQSAKKASRIYNFFKEKGFKYLQFIPCLDELGELRGCNSYSLTPEAYGGFLKGLFDSWYSDFIKGDYISIRHFDAWIRMLGGEAPETCSLSGTCNCYFAVEADGSVYPCDFYILDQWKLGNIMQANFKDMKLSLKASEFVESSKHMAEKCKTCKFLFICRGGCRRDREPFGEGKPDLNYFCSAYYDFFSYSLDRMTNALKLVNNTYV